VESSRVVPLDMKYALKRHCRGTRSTLKQMEGAPKIIDRFSVSLCRALRLTEFYMFILDVMWDLLRRPAVLISC
jgi:hypothetical protein